jgi:hypothetical protein
MRSTQCSAAFSSVIQAKIQFESKTRSSRLLSSKDSRLTGISCIADARVGPNLTSYSCKPRFTGVTNSWSSFPNEA